MDIGGKSLGDKNFWFRMLIVIFAGMAALAVLISWRSQLMFSSEYVEISVNNRKKQPNLIQANAQMLKEEMKLEQ